VLQSLFPSFSTDGHPLSSKNPAQSQVSILNENTSRPLINSDILNDTLIKDIRVIPLLVRAYPAWVGCRHKAYPGSGILPGYPTLGSCLPGSRPARALTAACFFPGCMPHAGDHTSSLPVP
jgi:hypothetical protein